MEEKIERLSENFDFIEEACGYGEPLTYTDKEELVLSEAAGSKSSFHILGKLSGVFAPIGEFSRNRRIYAPNHWNKVIESEDVQNRLKNRSMFGMIGHEDAKVTDERIREGLISHIVTKMEVREDMNGKPFLYGELEILDTPAGRILKAMHEGGAGLYVSSRGAGKLVPIAGDPINKMVSPDSFYLETWDIVKNPGFLQAKPVYEGVTESKETIKESAPKPTLSDEERIPLSSIKADQVMNDYSSLRSMNPYDEKEQIKKAKKLHSVFNALPPEKANEEVAELKGQIDKLAKIIEKVVDDVYEVDEASVEESKTPESAAEPQSKQPQISEAMEDFLKLLSETNITDEAVSDIFDIMFNKKEENK